MERSPGASCAARSARCRHGYSAARKKRRRSASDAAVRMRHPRTRIRRAAEIDRMVRRDSKTTSTSRCRRTSSRRGLPHDKSVDTMLAARRARRGAAFRSRSSRCSPRMRAWRGCSPIVQGRGNRLLQKDRYLSDHARDRLAAVAGRASIPGSPSICSTPSTRRRRSRWSAWQNPRIVPLAWYREAWEEQEKILGPDPWEYGLTRQEPEESGDAGRLFARAGTDQEKARRSRSFFSTSTQGTQARRRVPHLGNGASARYNKRHVEETSHVRN